MERKRLGNLSDTQIDLSRLTSAIFIGGNEMKWIKDFIWGTFNRRNKGIKWYRWAIVEYDLANIRSKRNECNQVD